jgi:cysteinyl-tRNA synthetase
MKKKILLFNTLTRRKEEFKPLKDKIVKMYTCGPTVYNFAHIGNFRAYVWEDLLRRYFKFKGFKVIQVMNLTDVDDKTIKGAQKQGKSLKEFTNFYKKAFFEDIKTLNIEKAEYYPEATAHIPEMIKIIKGLLRKGFAYKAEDNSIYFSVKKFKNYGKLSKFKLKFLKKNVRVNLDEYDKQSAADFSLWKAWTPEDGNVFWNTELGKGRPGWHIECSAMSMKYLGETFDIHTGGIDNMFPHHENEIAQSEAFTGKKFVNYWLHCKHLIVNGKKMSKSLGNFYTLRDLLKKGYSARAIRFTLLNTHYRNTLNFTEQSLKANEKAIKKIDEFIIKLSEFNENNALNIKAEKLIEKLLENFENALDNDLSITEAIAALFDFIRDFNKLIQNNKISKKQARKALNALKKIDLVLGIMDFSLILKKQKIPLEIQKIVLEREKFRKQKNFRKADELRELLRKKGYRVDDTPTGPKIFKEK